MKKIVLFGLTSVAALVMVACSPRPVRPSSAASPAGAPSLSGLPTARGSAPAATAPASAGATPVAVILSDNHINASTTTFKVGVPYTFMIKNTGPRDTCFNISVPVAVTGSLGASAAKALLAIDQRDLTTGQQATARVTFPPAALGMPLEFSCLMRRHYDDGMRLRITVTQ